MKLMNKLAFGMSLLVVAQNALAIAIGAGYRDFRSKSVPKCLSGITYAGVEGGKNIFYAVADNGADIGLYKVTIGGFNSDGDISGTPSVGSRVQLAGATDIEGVAYDPASGHVWVADEGKQTITEYNPSTGEALRQAPVPAVLGTSKIVGNYGFESLTISGDGLAMWTANEEALTIDGERSSFDSGTVVRLVKFARTTVNDEWKLAAMYAYKTDKWHNRYGLGGSGRRGVSDLCALPDGSLLVLERELSSTMSGTSVDAKVSGLFYCEIYQVTPASLAAATDVCSYDEGLKTRTGWSVVQKTRLYSLTTKGSVYYISWSNIEGLCLGPRHSSGGTVLMGVSDAGDGTTNAEWVPFVMTGLNIRTLSFAKPSAGVSSIVGSNYRFVDGNVVTLDLTGMSRSYVIDGTDKHICQGWSVSNQTPSSGTGTHASFTVAADGTFAWNVNSETASTGYHIVDSFEGFAEGTTADALDGWSGEECSVVAQSYTPPTPPGYVMTQETHAKVLDATDDEAIRTLPTQMPGDDKIDVMVCAKRPVVELKTLSDDIQLRIALDPLGRLCVWHSYEENGAWKRGWIPLSETTYADGEWVRVGIELDYTSNPNGDAFVKVTVNGSCQPTAHGVRSPTDLRAYGPWHYLAKNRRTGGVSRPSTIRFSGTKVDDLMLCKKTVAPEHTGATSVDGIAFAWFDSAGLPRNPLAAAPFVPGYTLGDIYTAGLDPYTERPLKVTDFCLDASGRPHVEFNGYKGETPVGYQMLYSSTPDFKSPVVLQLTDGNFDGNAATWSTMWNGKVSSGDSGAGFYRVKAVR